MRSQSTEEAEQYREIMIANYQAPKRQVELAHAQRPLQIALSEASPNTCFIEETAWLRGPQKPP